jgi:hypothetical protein
VAQRCTRSQAHDSILVSSPAYLPPRREHVCSARIVGDAHSSKCLADKAEACNFFVNMPRPRDADRTDTDAA